MNGVCRAAPGFGRVCLLLYNVKMFIMLKAICMIVLLYCIWIITSNILFFQLCLCMGRRKNIKDWLKIYLFIFTDFEILYIYWQKYSIHHFLIYSWIFFRILEFFFQSKNFAIPNPDQPPYDLTWLIRFSKPKLNFFVNDISWYHTSKKGSLSIETKWIACARSKRDI